MFDGFDIVTLGEADKGIDLLMKLFHYSNRAFPPQSASAVGNAARQFMATPIEYTSKAEITLDCDKLASLPEQVAAMSYPDDEAYTDSIGTSRFIDSQNSRKMIIYYQKLSKFLSLHGSEIGDKVADICALTGYCIAMRRNDDIWAKEQVFEEKMDREERIREYGASLSKAKQLLASLRVFSRHMKPGSDEQVLFLDRVLKPCQVMVEITMGPTAGFQIAAASHLLRHPNLGRGLA